MEIGNLIFYLFFLVVILIFINWMLLVMFNIILRSFALNYIVKRGDLKEVHVLRNFGWALQNMFLFRSFKSDFYETFRRAYYYHQIRNKNYRKAVDKFGNILRIALGTFNILFLATVLLVLITVVLGIITKAILLGREIL